MYPQLNAVFARIDLRLIAKVRSGELANFYSEILEIFIDKYRELLGEIQRPDFKQTFFQKFTVYSLVNWTSNPLEPIPATRDVVFRICNALCEQNNLSDTLFLLAYFSNMHGFELSMPIAIEDAKKSLQRDHDCDQIRLWENYSTEQNVDA